MHVRTDSLNSRVQGTVQFMCRWLVAGCFLLTALGSMLGCDTRASRMEEMKRAAIRRTKDEDEAPPPPKKEPKKEEIAEPKKKEEPKQPQKKEEPKEEETPAVAAAPPPRELPQSRFDERAWVLQSMREISGALKAYADEHPSFLKRAIRDSADVPLLSWRVNILPLLGYNELYEKFALDEPWDSRTNLALLKEIPDVYKCPSRMDEKTNLLAPIGRTTLFNEDFDSVLVMRIEDGLKNTICLIEVDDDLAVPWTKPDDYDTSNLVGIGTKRSDGIFVAFGDGTVRRIPNTVKPADFMAALTIDGGEPVTMAKISFAVAADPSRATEVDDIDMSNLAKLGGLAGEVDANEAETDVRDAMTKPDEEELVVDDRPDPPPEASLEASRQIFRDIYGPVYKEANTRDKKVDLARELFDKAKAMEDDINGRYVMLQAARVVAIEADEGKVATEIINELVKHYRVDDVPLKSELLISLGKEMDDQSIEMAKEVAEAAVLRDDFQTASKVLQLAMAALKREESGSRRRRTGFGSRDRRNDDNEPSDEETELINLRRRVEAGKSEYRKFRSALVGLDEGSPEANTVAGRYLCFVKEEWEKGLPILAKAHDPALREIAAMELVDLPSAEQQLEIGEAWWKYGADELQAGMRHVVWEHAALWFLAAHNSLPDGLLRVKAEMHINECSKELGSSVVDELRSRFGPRMRQRTARESAAARRSDDGDDND